MIEAFRARCLMAGSAGGRCGGGWGRSWDMSGVRGGEDGWGSVGWAGKGLVALDDLFVEGGEGFRAHVPAGADNQFVGQISACAQGFERRSQTCFVFKHQVVDRGKAGEGIRDFVTRPIIQAAKNPVGLDQNEIAD